MVGWAGAGSDRGSARRIELEEWEHVTCMKTVSLRSEETVSGLKGYVAAGTCLMQGEEVTCRGRVPVHCTVGCFPESLTSTH